MFYSLATRKVEIFGNYILLVDRMFQNNNCTEKNSMTAFQSFCVN